VGDAAVRLLVTPSSSAGVLFAWVSDVAREDVERGPEGASRHDAVCVAALAQGTTPLPARFGQRFESDQDCLAHLVERRAVLLAALRRVEGLVEMGLMVILPVAPATRVTAQGTTSGRDYLLRLREAHRHEASVAEISDNFRGRIADAVCGVVREEAVRLSLTPRPHVAISHLVARTDEAAYRRALAPLAADTDSGALIVTGPSAPYTFATLDT
jgi:hypothetical protein